VSGTLFAWGAHEHDDGRPEASSGAPGQRSGLGARTGAFRRTQTQGYLGHIEQVQSALSNVPLRLRRGVFPSRRIHDSGDIRAVGRTSSAQRSHAHPLGAQRTAHFTLLRRNPPDRGAIQGSGAVVHNQRDEIEPDARGSDHRKRRHRHPNFCRRPTNTSGAAPTSTSSCRTYAIWID